MHNSKQKKLFQHLNQKRHLALFCQFFFTLILTMFIVTMSSATEQRAFVHFLDEEANNETEIEQTIRISADAQDFPKISAIVVHTDLMWTWEMHPSVEVNGVSETITREGDRGYYNFNTSFGTLTKNKTCKCPSTNNDQVRIYRTHVDIEPNNSTINAVSLGTVVKFTFFYENSFGQSFVITVNYVREDFKFVSGVLNQRVVSLIVQVTMTRSHPSSLMLLHTLKMNLI